MTPKMSKDELVCVLKDPNVWELKLWDHDGFLLIAPSISSQWNQSIAVRIHMKVHW